MQIPLIFESILIDGYATINFRTAKLHKKKNIVLVTQIDSVLN